MLLLSFFYELKNGNSSKMWSCQYYFNFNETLEEKGRWEQHKDFVYCFELILEAALYKTAVIRPLTYHLTNHSSKTSEKCWSLPMK